MQNPTKEEEWAQKKQIIEQYLKDPRFTGGRDRLYGHIRIKHPNISRRDVAKVLKDDPIHQIHAPLKRRVTTRPIVVSDRAKVVQIDLVDFQKLAGKNEGYRYFLSYVDLFSKWCAARPIKNKTQANVTAALLNILDSIPEKWRPSTIQADNGSEFQQGMANALAARGIKLIHSQAYNPRSQGAVERLNKSLKQPIFSLMARHNSYKWIDFLQPLVENLNSSKHESTGYTPLDLMERPELSQDTIDEIHERMERRRPKHNEMHQVYEIGDFVRVALTTESAIRKQTFRKKIMNNWSSIVFQIYSISDPSAASTQPQYLLYNTVTKRRSKKKYWGFQLQKVTGDAAAEGSEQSVPAPAPNDDDEDEELVAADYEPEAQQPRRSARAWAPSRAALQNLAR